MSANLLFVPFHLAASALKGGEDDSGAPVNAGTYVCVLYTRRPSRVSCVCARAAVAQGRKRLLLDAACLVKRFLSFGGLLECRCRLFSLTNCRIAQNFSQSCCFDFTIPHSIYKQVFSAAIFHLLMLKFVRSKRKYLL